MPWNNQGSGGPQATGQTSRFNQFYEQCKKAPDVTRQRLYLETMERVFGGSDKIILDGPGQAGAGVVPYLPLPELRNRTQAQPPQPTASSTNQPTTGAAR